MLFRSYGLGTLIDRYDWPMAFLICSCLTLVVAAIWSLGTRPAWYGGWHAQNMDVMGVEAPSRSEHPHALRIRAHGRATRPA